MPLPIKHYFEQSTFEYEMSHIFNKAPQLVGLSSMVPTPNSYHVLARSMNTKMLVRDDEKIRMLSNICLHRQSNIAKGQGPITSDFKCPVHHWTYGLDGAVKSAPLFDKLDCAKLRLQETPLQEWNGLLFAGPGNVAQDLAEFPLPFLKTMELDKFKYSRSITERAHFNWKHFVDGFAEDYHVPFVHPGFNQFVNVETIQSLSQPRFCGQSVSLRSRRQLESEATTPAYRRWVNLLLKQYPGELPNPGGVCLLYYPNVMIEWYPKFLIVTTLVPVSVGETVLNVDFYHEESVMRDCPELVAAAEATYDETGGEDFRMCEQLAEGRSGLYKMNLSETGPTHPVYENGLLSFHKYYLSQFRA